MHLHKGGAHPRSRGENRSRARDLLGAGGSSPLTRGKQVSATFAANHRRLIPAHAGKTGCRRSGHGRRRAHPRSRGENTGSGFSCVCRRGSSPLTRGKRLGSGIEELADRLIPAHAGKTPAGQTLRGLATAHPRSRGENAKGARNPVMETGSSPLTRGKHFPTCAFTAQIDQILETLELAVSSGSYSVWVACATDAPQDQVRSIGLVLPSSRGAS